MAKVITLAHQKGGVGKTTLCFNLAYCYKDDLRVSLLDIDAQGSLSGISRYLEGVEVHGGNHLGNLAQLGADLILIDTPPYLSDQLPAIFNLSDLVLIPTKAGLLDIMAIRATIQLVKEAQKVKPTLRGAIVLNMVKSRTSLTDEMKEILAEYDLPVLTTMIGDRVSFARSAVTNGAINSEDERAKEEISNLAGEVLDYLH